MTNIDDKMKHELPENAYRELKEGEVYEPIMKPNKIYPEVNAWSVIWGIVMAAIFSAAAAYLGLKIGQVFEAAIPIAIIAVGASTLAKRKNPLGENVIIQSIGASSGVIVAGAIFTLPALFIISETTPGLDLQVEFYQIFLASLFGGFLGILFLIPFRKYFVSDMHGKYPFPEATATTEILVSGAKGGNQAKLLLISGLIGGVYDFVVATFGAWAEVFSSRVLPYGEKIANEFKLVFKLNIGAAVMGMGYIIGLKYALIIACGSFFAWWVIVPLFSQFAMVDGDTITLLSSMSAEEIFNTYARYIGIGAIAMAGLIGVAKSSKIIKTAMGLAVSETFSKSTRSENQKRTERDIPMKIILFGLIVTTLLIFLFFWLGVVDNLLIALVGVAIVMFFAFLFTTVAANAIAIVGTNPVSGMTMMTLILSSFVLAAVGLSGPSGMVAALIIGGVVCTALAMAGGFITDLKIGYWIGTSPYKQETWKFLGTFVSAITVGGVILILSKTYGYTGEGSMVAPQANAMASIIKPLMSGESTPWMLYIGGAFLALILDKLKVPALAFALGMFIPIQLNTPLLVGGAIAWYVASRSKDEKVNNARRDRGTLVASGLIAGGAIMGVVSAILRFANIDMFMTAWSKTAAAEYLGLGMFVLLCAYLIWDAKQAKVEPENQE
ncbi:MAG: oligopeptide transporter, OPT family [Bacteroidales bacterium]|nr:oligopeptide transporter, OPT family [Bacteroidales bacterium]